MKNPCKYRVILLRFLRVQNRSKTSFLLGFCHFILFHTHTIHYIHTYRYNIEGYIDNNIQGIYKAYTGNRKLRLCKPFISQITFFMIKYFLKNGYWISSLCVLYLLYTLDLSWQKYVILLVNMGVFAYFVAIRSIAFGIHKTIETMVKIDMKKQEDEDKNRHN